VAHRRLRKRRVDWRTWKTEPVACAQLQLFEAADVESNAANHIGFELQLDQLERAVRSIQLAHKSTIKLTKIGQLACLELGGMIRQGKEQVETKVTQRVPVQILAPQQLAFYVEPHLGEPDVILELPKAQAQLKSVVERLKNISDRIELSSAQTGRFQLSCTTDMCSVSVEFKRLKPANVNAEHRPPDDNTATVVVAAKNLAKVMGASALSVNNGNCYAFFKHNHGIVIHATAPPPVAYWLSFHIPALSY
jgi:hypothetical protein